LRSTKSHESLAEACPRGIDVVVIIHHQVRQRLPCGGKLWSNPKPRDDLLVSGICVLWRCVFMVAAGTLRLPAPNGEGAGATFDLLGCLDLVALATLCATWCRLKGSIAPV